MVSSLETIAAHSWKGSGLDCQTAQSCEEGDSVLLLKIKTHKINTTICPTLLLNQPTTKSLCAPIAFGSRKSEPEGRTLSHWLRARNLFCFYLAEGGDCAKEGNPRKTITYIEDAQSVGTACTFARIACLVWVLPHTLVGAVAVSL